MNSLKNFYARLTNQDYVYDEGNLVGVTCTNKMLDELEGIAIDSLSIQEELETLRASNTIKQGNIERLEAENEQLEDKLQEQLCTVGSLLEENVKFIAERDDLIHDRDMLKMCADHYEDELKRMHAEREQWMKPKHKRADQLVVGDHIKRSGEIFQITNSDGYIKINSDESYLPPECLVEMVYPLSTHAPLIKEAIVEYFGRKCPDYDADCKCCQAWSQFEALPAQQIPEGYALVDKTELNKIHRDLDSCQKVIWLAGGFDPSYCKDAQESLKLIDAMLSASQPKGESIERPANCRNRLHDEGKAYPRSGCYHCKTGGLTGCPFDKPKGDV